jgi:two-component system, OmpR family, response regulator MprA
MASKVLIVDDDPAIVRMLERTLRADGYETYTASDGGSALAAVESRPPDVIVLDVTMPGVSGIAVSRRLRQKGDAVPILLLTARDALSDRVEGLDAGADDYLVKPFEPDELRARLRALLRRRAAAAPLTYGDLSVDVSERAATRGGREIGLTGREAQLLALLIRSAGKVVTREEALTTVWGDGRLPTGNTVDRYVAYLRTKLGPPQLIHTVRGVGFVLRR